ncbi:CARDB domain-containing protein, partial [Salinirubrum litoreum]
DVTVLGSGSEEVVIADDGSSADAEYAFRDTADTGSVPVVEVTVAGVAAGETDLSLEAAAGNDGVIVFDESGTGYDVTGTTGATLTVEGEEPADPASFQVSNLQAPASVTQGDAIDVSATVTNDGGEAATKSVAFRVDTDGDGEIADESAVVSQDVQLDAGASTTVTFEDVDTSGLGPGTLTHGVATDDDSATAQITIEAPPADAETTLSLDPESDSVDVGDETTFTVVVDDAQGGVGAAEIGLAVGDSSIAQITDVTVLGSGSEEVVIADDGSSADAEYAFRDTADTGSVPVVEVTVTGQSDGETDLSLEAAGDNEEILVFDESGTGYDVTGTTGATLTVEADDPTPEPDPANFQVSNLDAPATVTQGDTIDVSATVTNDGDETATKTVEFRVDANGDGLGDAGDVVLGEDVELAGGESTTVTFEDVDTSGLSPGTYTHGVVTPDDSVTAQITVEAPPTPATFDVSNLQAPASVTQGDTIDVSADVANTGDQTATKTVEFRVDTDGDGEVGDESAVRSKDVELAAGASTTVTFADVDTSGLPVGTLTHGVVTPDDSATAQLTVEAPPTPANFAVSDLQAPDSAAPGDTIEVSATVTNDGEQAATKTVEFRLDLNGDGELTADETVATEEVTLDAGASTSVTFSPTVPEGIALGEYAHGVFGDTSQTATIRIAPPKLNPQFAGQPIDTDGDGTYEDVNGDGTVDEVDTQALFANLDDPILDEYEAQFDYNGNGEFDVVDVQFHFSNEISDSGESTGLFTDISQVIDLVVDLFTGWF